MAYSLPPIAAPLRERHKASTIETILAAVSRCLRDTALVDLTYARLAAEANVGERTIYRYFPTKQGLLEHWWKYFQKSIGQGPYPETAADLIAAPRTVYPQFDRQAELIRGTILSEQGRQIVQQTNPARRDAFRRAVLDGVGKLPEAELTRLCAQVQVLYSAAAWMTMHDVWELSGEESGLAAAEAIGVLLREARKRARRIKRGGK
jgi:AcrR family transcriptional regulator